MQVSSPRRDLRDLLQEEMNMLAKELKYMDKIYMLAKVTAAMSENGSKIQRPVMA